LAWPSCGEQAASKREKFLMGQAGNLVRAKIIIGRFIENDTDKSGFWCVAKT
jgi:hypothetical protein